MSKPCLIFSTFWFAEKCLKDKHFYVFDNTEKIFEIDLTDEKYMLYSIALYPPKSSDIPECHKAGIKKAPKEFMPTVNMLHDYKNGHDWDAYIQKFVQRLQLGKQSVIDFVNSLQDDMVYFLCCWENTSKGAKCHRKIIYDALIKSHLGEKLNLIYSDK